MLRELPLRIPSEAVAESCRRHGVRRLSLFGSVLRADFGPTSDIDMLVEFEPGARVTLFTLARLQNELSDLLGRRADLHEPSSLSPYLRDRILARTEALYVAA
jgi:hypothetical protein